MRENLFVRFNDHQVVDGVPEFSVEICTTFSDDFRYSRTVTGASHDELTPLIADAFIEIMRGLKIPPVRPQIVYKPHESQPDLPIEPASPPGFAAKGIAKFAAEVYRNGQRVED